MDALQDATVQHRQISRAGALFEDLIAAESQEIGRLYSLINRLKVAAERHPDDADLQAALTEALDLHDSRIRWINILRTGTQVLSAARDRAYALVVMFRKPKP